jgi:hypothetical protein
MNIKAIGKSGVAAAARALTLTGAAARWLAGPGFLAFAFFLIGSGLVVSGVYLLLGMGWALLAAAVPFLAAAAILTRGIGRV